MKIVIALRLKSVHHVQHAVENKKRGTLINYNIEKTIPALKNIAGRLSQTNKIIDILDGCRVYWALVDSNISIDEWLGWNEVETVIPYDKLDEFTTSIRGRRGATYLDACDAFADDLTCYHEQSRAIDYVPDIPRATATV